MADFKEQRICIKFCFKLKKSAVKTHRMLVETFGDNAMSQSKTLGSTGTLLQYCFPKYNF
jgi:hypothetical protein